MFELVPAPKNVNRAIIERASHYNERPPRNARELRSIYESVAEFDETMNGKIRRGTGMALLTFRIAEFLPDKARNKN